MNRQFPANLYRKTDKRSGETYFSYRDPRNGKTRGLGTDMERAIKLAHVLNAGVYQDIQAAQLAALIAPKRPDSPTFKSVIDRHLELCVDRMRPATLKKRRYFAGAWEKAICVEGKEDIRIEEIQLRQIVEVLETFNDRMASKKAMRQVATEIWKDAMQEGWAQDNLPSKTRSITNVEVKRSRLSLADFWKIHAVALQQRDSWIARAMEIALVTVQRREDIAVFEFKERKDSIAWLEDNHLYVVQQKEGAKVRIDFNVGIAGFTVGGVIKACRDDVVSRWIMHHHRKYGNTMPGDPIGLESFSKKFAEVRDLAGVKGEEGKEPPTFHEIRSLAIREYSKKYGAEFAQAIAGHKKSATTDLYRDMRGSDWIAVGQ